MNITVLQHQQGSLLSLSSLSFPLLCEQTCNSRRWRYAAGKTEATCLICKSCHLTSGVAISYSAARQRPWKKQAGWMQTTARLQLCSKAGEGGRIDRTCKYRVEIQIQWDERSNNNNIKKKRAMRYMSFMLQFQYALVISSFFDENDINLMF